MVKKLKLKRYNVTVWANGTESENWEVEAETRTEAMDEVLDDINITVDEVEN